MQKIEEEMKNLSLTSWLDGVVGWFADQAGIDKGDYVSQTAGEGIASGIELVCDLFTKGLLNTFLQVGIGAGLGAYAIWGNPNPRLRKELITIANHLEMRVIDQNPQSILSLRESLDGVINGLKLGGKAGMEKVLDSLLVSLDEMKDGLGALGIPVNDKLPMPSMALPIPEIKVKPVKEGRKVEFL